MHTDTHAPHTPVSIKSGTSQALDLILLGVGAKEERLLTKREHFNLLYFCITSNAV